MTEITPGALCLCRQIGRQLFVAVRQNGDGSWHLRGKLVDHKGRAAFNGRSSVSAGDITVIKEAPVYQPHEMLEHAGRYHEILRDLGDAVELLRPEHSYPLKDGSVRIPPGRITVPKSDLVLECLH